ncbi:protein dopey-1-like isoform X2 [Rhopilema esculentum]|uniref:protein dopey-1-like isoform X2 n=1 Tax=Rhopilema esculentum TaxID=499914 RepID=UPI0031D8C090
MEEELSYLSDGKFKQYGTAVDKALKSFEYSSEWADLISCLGKLNKVILTYSSFPLIPRKLLVGKRLAQCLHPALPSGVHLKALETYQLIFKQIGKGRLINDLFIYSSGLFPLLAQAAISVKPVLLDLYEEFYVPLGRHIIPGLPGFILAVLPGIEEGSEHNERTTSILETVCQNSNKESFYSALWGCVLHSTQVRLSAITFVLNHLAKATDGRDTSYVFGNNRALMVDSICAALEDTNVLAQRITLDLLLTFLPISTQQVEESDIVKILVCALNVVLRRDMSLNRRLYHWILNTGTGSMGNKLTRTDSNDSSNQGVPDESTASSLTFFEKYSKKFVVEAVIILFRLLSQDQSVADSIRFSHTESKMEKLRPLRILISLLDKPEIGSPVLEEVLVEVFRALHHECSVHMTVEERLSTNDELLKTANLLFNAFEPYFIWEFLERALINSFIIDKRDSGMLLDEMHGDVGKSSPIVINTRQPRCSELFSLAELLLDIVYLDASSATQSEHWPSLLICLVSEMTDYVKTMNIDEINQGMLLALKLLSKISPDIRSPASTKRTRSQSSKTLFSRVGRRKNHKDLAEGQEQSTPVSSNDEQHSHSQKDSERCNEESSSIQLCVAKSTAFFHAFVRHRIMPWLSDNATNNASTNECNGSDVHEHSDEETQGSKKPTEATCVLTFAASCRYLVELACFPCWESSAEIDETKNYKHTLSPWLQSLISCASQAKDIDIQTVAMGALLDLINVSLCVFPSLDRGHVTKGAANIIPLISHRDFSILEKSAVYKDMALILWSQIGPANCQLNSACAELFLRLHNVSPSSLVCEDAISSSMVAHCLNQRRSAHWKFSVLWHLSREFYKNESSKSSRGGNRSLDRCMLLMLDSLQSDDPTISKRSQEWLQHSVHFGDIGRILEPLLITMLNPSSRRISVHYTFLWKSNNQHTARPQSITSEKHQGKPNWSNVENYKQSTSTDSQSDQMDSVADISEEPFNEELDTRASGEDAQEALNNEDSDDREASSRMQSAEGDEQQQQEQQQQEQQQQEQQQQFETEEVQEDEGNSKEVSGDAEESRNEMNENTSREKHARVTVHPLHVHRLFYTQLYDTTQTIYALKTVMSILEVDGKAFVFASATTSMNMCNTAHQTALRELLIRHRRALSGKDFYGSLADSQQLLVKASTAKYMEIILSVCLYFIRSDFHASMKVSRSDLEDNFRVKVSSLNVLTKIVDVLLQVVADDDVGFSNFVSDLFNRCKVQRIALHCLLSVVYGASGENETARKDLEKTRTASSQDEKSRVYMHGFLLRFVKKLIFLEDHIGVGMSSLQQGSNEKKLKRKDKKSKAKPLKTSPFEYNIETPIVSQTMYLSVLLMALKGDKSFYNHDDWINVVIETLPKCGSSLAKIVIPVVEQICQNFKSTAKIFSESVNGNIIKSREFPVDYMLTMLEKMTSICHYCLVDKDASSVLQHGASVKPGQDLQRSDNSMSILESLAHVFSPQSLPNRGATSEEVNNPYIEAREGLLSILPTILSSVLMVWHVWNATDSKTSRWRIVSELPLPIGSPKSIKQAVLQLLTPVAMQHTPVFLAALADVWNSSKKSNQEGETEKSPNLDKQTRKEKKWLSSVNQKTVPFITDEQQGLVDIALAIKVLSAETIVLTTKQVLRQTLIGKEKGSTGSQSLELNLLQFLFEYLKRVSNDQLSLMKPVLLAFLKEGVNLNVAPAGLFVLLNILYVFILRIQCPEEKRARKELQDLALKYFDAVNTIAGASLENSTWFRRNVAVLPQSDQNPDEPLVKPKEHTNDNPEPTVPVAPTMQTRNAQYSASALCLMAEILSSMLDLLYLSEEKDKITSFMFYVIYNVTPYLKNHSNQNVTSFRGSSALLASITDFQYTLRSWKKDVYELFLDPGFFKMDLLSLQYWRSIIDRLMTYDVATFRDLMARINLTQSGTINIFANREQEIELRAGLLKRLTFVLFCGEIDQYHNYMPDIQERLVDSLRQMQAPVLYEQVFFCFRVLILRMSPHHLTSLWPPIITELIVIFLQMEKDLSPAESQQAKSSIMGTLESFFTFNGMLRNKGKWLNLYLEACKLLDLSFSLQSDTLPHFQSYRWAFIDTPGVEYEAEEVEHNRDGDKNGKATSQGKVVATSSKTHGNSQAKPAKSVEDSVSKLSVMNAPLSSKLRKSEKKGGKSKTSHDKTSDNVLRMRFAPYLSRLATLIVQKHAENDGSEGKTTHPLQLAKIDSIFELLPFLLSITNSRAVLHEEIQSKLDFASLTNEMLEELVEKDFQDQA